MDYNLLVRPSAPTFYIAQLDNDAFAALKAALKKAYPENEILTLRGSRCQTLEGFYNELGAVLQVPHYFGENWDALNDILYENSWLPGYILLIADAPLLLNAAPERHFKSFVELMDKCNADNLVDEDQITDDDDFGFHVVLQCSADAVDAFSKKLETTGTAFAELA